MFPWTWVPPPPRVHASPLSPLTSHLSQTLGQLVPKSVITRELSADDNWQDTVSWDNLDDIYDPLFQGSSITGAESLAIDNDNNHAHTLPDYSLPIPTTPNFNFPSAPPSVADGNFSFDYIVSAPPSVVDGPPSLSRSFSWISASPSYSTTATSPVIGRDDGALFEDLCNSFDHRPFSQRTGTESPMPDLGEQILAHNFDSNTSFPSTSQPVFNPYLPGTPYAFNSLDLSSTQALSNFGGWVDPAFNVGSIGSFSELDHDQAIPIPNQHQTYTNDMSFVPSPTGPVPSRGINIPIPTHRATPFHPYNPPYNTPSLSWSQQVPPPIVSQSPEARRRSQAHPLSRSVSRSVSRSEPRRSRPGLTQPSPTSNNLGWVSYQPNQQTQRLVASATEGNGGRRQRGRTKALTQDQRKNAALMRLIKACTNCKRRKEKCDPGTPCRSCLDHFKGNLIHNPCRGRSLSTLSKTFLSERLAWHPTARSLESFISPHDFTILDSITYTIPIHLGFGPVLYVPVHALQSQAPDTLYHDHVVYSWPPSDSTMEVHTHAVLPAVISPEGVSRLTATLDNHLTLIVDQHFRSFPLYCSPLRILRDIYIFYRSLGDAIHSSVLQKALKLLVLVHIGGDLTLPALSSNDALYQLVRTSLPLKSGLVDSDSTPTPCFIRSQLGSVLPTIAHALMESVLGSLELLLLNHEVEEWPVTLATILVLLMTIESIHYHDAKLPYHHRYDAKSQPDHQTKAEERKLDDQNVDTLLGFYTSCYPESYAWLHLELDDERSTNDNKFIDSVRVTLRNVSVRGYLEKKATEERGEDDMGYFFDRLVARLLVSKV